MCRWSWNLEPQTSGTFMVCPGQYRDWFTFFSFRTQNCGICPAEHSACLTLQGHCGLHGDTLLQLLPWVTSNFLSDADEILSFFFQWRPSNWGTLKVRAERSCEISALRAFINVDYLTNSKEANYGNREFVWLGSARGSTLTSDLPSPIALLIFKTKNEQSVQTATISASRAAEPAMWTHLYALF